MLGGYDPFKRFRIKWLKFFCIIFALIIITRFVVRLTIRSTLLINQPGFSQAVFDKNGKLLKLTLSTDERYRLWTSLDEIAPALVEKTLEKEDAYFYWHPGVNPWALVRGAYLTYIAGRSSGGSTITMQLARLRYGIGSRSISGKLKQIAAALAFEALYTKKEILEAYLNLAPYGGNIEGVGAASWVYFQKVPNRLTDDESFILSLIPQSPAARNPSGKTISEIFFARKDALPSNALHFVRRVAEENPFVARIYSTLDSGVQERIETQVHNFVERNKKIGISNATALLVDYRSMEVRGYVGSADFFNSGIQGQVDGIAARRSPGSALKPFIYSLALEKGLIHPHSVLKDTAFSRTAYNPENYDKEFLGPINATEALIRSRNMPAVSLLNQLHTEEFYKFLKTANVGGLREENFYGLSAALGGIEVRMDELATLYAMLANGGMWKPLKFLKDDKERRDDEIMLLTPEASFLTIEMLRDNRRPSTAVESVHQQGLLNIPWKTGTSFGFRDAWAAGIVGPYVLVVWVGNFDNQSNPAFIGRDTAGPLFFSIVDALRGEERLEENIVHTHLNVKKVKVCSVSGELPGPHCSATKQSWFIPGVSPIHTCSIHREIDIDSVSGLRVCNKGGSNTVKEIYEIWPSDLATLFRTAGLPRRAPPPFMPGCLQGRDAVGPQITSPEKTLQYSARLGDEAVIPLRAVVDGESHDLFWFIDDELLGKVKSGEELLWNSQPGTFLVRVADDAGRGDSVRVVVAALP